jgi:hypothetical protein
MAFDGRGYLSGAPFKVFPILLEHTPLHLLTLGFGNFPVPKKAFLFCLGSFGFALS